MQSPVPRVKRKILIFLGMGEITDLISSCLDTQILAPTYTVRYMSFSSYSCTHDLTRQAHMNAI